VNDGGATGAGELTVVQMLIRVIIPFVVSEHNSAGVVLGFGWNLRRIPLDELFGAGSPGVARLWGRDLGVDDDERGACVNGSCGRRRNGEGEGGEDHGEKLHRQMLG